MGFMLDCCFHNIQRIANNTKFISINLILSIVFFGLFDKLSEIDIISGKNVSTTY